MTENPDELRLTPLRMEILERFGDLIAEVPEAEEAIYKHLVAQRRAQMREMHLAAQARTDAMLRARGDQPD